MQKKVSFIVPKVDASGNGKVSKSVVRKLLNYSITDVGDMKNLINASINGEPLVIENTSYLWEDGEYIVYLSNDVLFTISTDGDISIDTTELSEGDRVDLFFSFENDITIEEKVHSSFEGLANGNVKFKVWRDGDIIIPAGTGDFSRTFITVVRKGTDEGSISYFIEPDTDNIICSLNDTLNPIFSVSRSIGTLYVTGGAIIQDGMGDFTGDFELISKVYDTVLLELVIE